MPLTNVKGGANLSDADYMAHWKSKCIMTATGCWEWQGFCFEFRNIKPGQRGYPSGSYRGQRCRVHRKALELKLGRLLSKHENACHRCDNPPCINPEHLFAATQEHNKLDEVAKGRSFYANKTHCKRGHPFDERNTEHQVSPKGRPRRACRECTRMRARQYYRNRVARFSQPQEQKS
jgi:hypothetical protein